jgi:uncharacterized membrane protein YtjA (UPF0391 family)
MGRIALLFLLVALVAALFGYGIIANLSYEVARLLSVAFLLFALFTLTSGILGRSRFRELG